MTAKAVVSNMLERADDVAMRDLVEAARGDKLDDDDIAELANGLATSGARLPLDQQAGDVASTGGPSSLSTLICPLQLRARGVNVPKLGVPGRPAGGVDTLQTIPGFRGALDPEAARAALIRFGYIHLRADERWAPLDATLFAYRQREGAQTLAPLVIASILAKKLAAGATGAGLEIRIAEYGNFGGDPDEARRNARRYKAVASPLGLRPVCMLTEATRPYQPYIGRGEALLALGEILAGRARGWLADHHALCQRMADAVATALGIDAADSVPLAALGRAHDNLLAAHGTRRSSFERRVDDVRSASRTTVRAERAGVVHYDLSRLRDLLVRRQRLEPAVAAGRPPDTAGVILESPAGAKVQVDEPVMSIRVPPGERELATELASCARVRPGEDGAARTESTLEII